jgi:hypothetical protein
MPPGPGPRPLPRPIPPPFPPGGYDPRPGYQCLPRGALCGRSSERCCSSSCRTFPGNNNNRCD